MTIVRLAAPAALALVLTACSSSGGGGGTPGPGCALPPATALTVVEAIPAQGATGVSIHASVSLRFNTCIDPSSIGAISFQRGAGPVAFHVAYDPVTATLTLVPDAPLDYSTTYYVSILPTLRGVRGEASTGWAGSFRTRATPELIPPATTATPAGGRYNHALDVTLACADDPGGTGCAGTYYTTDGRAPGLSSARYVGPLAITTTTTLRFASVDGEGNWESPRSESYVIDVDPPGVASVFPPDGATGVALDAVPAVTFDEAMDAATLGSSRIAFVPRVDTLSAYDPATFTASYLPDGLLDCATTYTVSYDGGARDVAGNALPGPFTWSFTTDGDCAEPVTTANVQDGVYAAPQAVTLTCDDGAGSGCARIVYTTDGSVPTRSHGTVVEGTSAGPIAIGEGDTVLRFFGVDRAGNREPVREERYAVSSTGFTYVATSGGLARGAGPVPARFVTIPTYGPTYGFFRDPTNGRLWRATSRGVAFSDDDISWTEGAALVDSYSSRLAASSVWAHGSLVLAGTHEGLYRSHDGGLSWQIALRVTSGYDVAQVLDVDGAGKDVFVATTLGLATSHDGSRSFTWRGFGTRYDDVDFDAATGQVYAASSAGLEHSTDRGETFSTWTTATTPALPSSEVRSVAVTAQYVHVATAAGYVRMDRGPTGAPTSARTLARPCANGDTSVLEVAVSGASVYLVTGERFVTGSTDAFCVSTDQGTSFAPRWFVAADRPNEVASTVHTEGARVYVGYPPGWYLSTDGGASFAQMELPVGVADVASSGGKVLAATSDGLAVSSDGFRSFTLRTTAHGLRDRDVRDLAVAGSTVYAATSWGLSVSTDGGMTFTVPYTTFVNPPQCVAAEGSTVFAGASTALYRSPDSGKSYTRQLPGAGSSDWLNATAAVAVRGSTVVLAESSTVWVSSDGGTTFTERGSAAGLVPPPGSYLSLYDVAVSPAGAIWIASNAGAHVSTDGGVTFTQPASMPAGVYVKSVDAEAGAPLYFGAGSGLGISTDGGATVTWRTEGLSFPRTAVYVP
ncbi:Ig-like domain-containing protein [Anaeromyxobacter terrae]|uniref:Ig-like domain-containing protein n=1 Tax=Anaeromyxobacter terrae TaxID=2925406 RepID=UPI001F57EEC5|nr:Ig-like domain-containing protein [Anaeromyxobacter sp. SG22]